ncbi:hypothetical protein DW906_03180 [Coprobacillus sp. AM42-12AC]|nr:hypothetical protein DW906_03180 [Coprobacillus sp. AM42-12AC]
MVKINKIKLYTNGDKYHLYIDGVEVKRITDMQIRKREHQFSEIIVTFSGILETSEEERE